MKDWEYSFDPISRALWHEQIEKDLKGKSIGTLQQTWWPGEPLIPLHHKEDAVTPRIVLPSKLFASPPAIIEFVKTSSLSPEDLNKQLLSALQFGAQKIILQTNGDEFSRDPKWLNGVFPEMIEWHIQHALNMVDQIPQVLLRKALMSTFIRCKRAQKPEAKRVPLQSLLGDTSRNALQVKFEYTIESTGVWDENTVLVFKSLLTDLEEWTSAGYEPNDFLDRCILVLHADAEYVKHIIQTRVIHLVWQNLIDSIVPGTASRHDYLECHLIPAQDEKPEAYLIRASVSCLAAALSGTSGLCVHHAPDQKVPYFYKRINRNIHHLLHLESGLPTSEDPVSGAWTIDYYTRRWTEMIWSGLSAG